MYYRMRVYQAVPENLEVFHHFFRERLLPVQLRHGARIVGRWETTDGGVVAVWEYDSPEHFEQVRAAVIADPDALAAQEHRRTLPTLITESEETFMRSTLHFLPNEVSGGRDDHFPLVDNPGEEPGLGTRGEGPSE